MANIRVNMIQALLSEPTLTQEQRARIDKLLGNTYKPQVQQDSEASNIEIPMKSQAKASIGSSIHNPKALASFFKKFTTTGYNLKYTTHKWDEGDYPNGFDSFVKAYTSEIDNDLYKWNSNVYNLIHNFLCPITKNNQDGSLYFWGKNKITLGYQYPPDAMRDWMNQNPGNQPENMPLSAFPEENRPQGKQNRGLKTFGDIILLFKKSIEFRDTDLYKKVRILFENSDIDLDPCVEDLKSYQFYTSTQDVGYALDRIAENIRNRKEHKNVKIYMESDKNSLTLNILHIDSYSDARRDSQKINLESGEGSMAIIKSRLISLCDFYVESRFMDSDGQLKDFRIKYLENKDPSTPPVWEEMPKGTSQGFKYCLKFYI